MIKSRLPKDRDRFFIDNAFFKGGWAGKLGPFAIAVYNAIAMHADFETAEAWPSHATIAKLTGMSARQVMREVENLERYNIVSVKSRQQERKPAIITLLDKSVWIPVEHMTGSHMTDSHMTDSHMSYDRESQEHMTPSHTNITHITKPKNKGAADFLDDVFTQQGKVSEATGTNPDDQYFIYRDAFLSAYQELTGELPSRVEKGEIIRIVDEGKITPECWREGLRQSILNWTGRSKTPPISRVEEVCLHGGGDYQKFKRWKWPENGQHQADSPKQKFIIEPVKKND